MHRIDAVAENEGFLASVKKRAQKLQEHQRLADSFAHVVMLTQLRRHHEHICVSRPHDPPLCAVTLLAVYTSRLLRRSFSMLMLLSLFSVADSRIFRTPSTPHAPPPRPRSTRSEPLSLAVRLKDGRMRYTSCVFSKTETGVSSSLP